MRRVNGMNCDLMQVEGGEYSRIEAQRSKVQRGSLTLVDKLQFQALESHK